MEYGRVLKTVSAAPPPGQKAVERISDWISDRTSSIPPLGRKARRQKAEIAALRQERTKERLAKLRFLRQQVQDLQKLLTHVRGGDAQLQQFAGSIGLCRTTIGALIQELIPEVHSHDADHDEVMGHIKTVWDRMSENPVFQQPDSATDSKALDRSFNFFDEDCHEIIYSVGWWTIPDRLTDWLSQERPGYYVPFHAVFEDEMPLEADRVKVLNYLAWSPKGVLRGLVDAEHGLVYRYSRSVWHQLGAFAAVIATPVVIAAIIVYLSDPSKDISLGWFHVPRFSVPNWPLSKGDHAAMAAMLVAGWFAVLAGVVAHAFVETAKRLQETSTLPSVVAPSELLHWISAFWGRITMRIMQALIPFFAVAFTQDLGKVTYLEFFLAGYALDSVIGLVGASLDKRSGAAVTNMKRQLGVSAAP